MSLEIIRLLCSSFLCVSQMYVNKHRSREDIIADILSIARKEPKKTQIMYRANLSYALLCKYMSMLTEAELVNYRKNVYVLTSKGAAYLERYAEYKSLENAMMNNELAINERKAVLNKILEG